VFAVVSKQLEDQSNIAEQLEASNDKLSHKVYKLEQQLLLERNKASTDDDRGTCADDVYIQIKHQVA